jgi:5'-nucleotidase
VTSLPDFPADTLLNVNLPPVPGSIVRETRLTRLGRRVFSQSLQPMKDPWGREIFWIGGGSSNWDASASDSDFRAIREGCVSVTPLHLDLTHVDMLDRAESWWRPI